MGSELFWAFCLIVSKKPRIYGIFSVFLAKNALFRSFFVFFCDFFVDFIDFFVLGGAWRCLGVLGGAWGVSGTPNTPKGENYFS